MIIKEFENSSLNQISKNKFLLYNKILDIGLKIKWKNKKITIEDLQTLAEFKKVAKINNILLDSKPKDFFVLFLVFLMYTDEKSDSYDLIFLINEIFNKIKVKKISGVFVFLLLYKYNIKVYNFFIFSTKEDILKKCSDADNILEHIEYFKTDILYRLKKPVKKFDFRKIK